MSLRLLALAGAAALAFAAPVRAQAGFVVEYPPVQAAEDAHTRAWLMERGQMDRLAVWLNRWIRMPREVALRMVECPASDIRWNADERSVEICYRMITRIYGIAGSDADLRRAITGAHLYMVLHGVAHAIVDELNLPTPNGEEAAVDELAVLLIAHAREPGMSTSTFVVGGITTLQRTDARWGEWAYATTHGLTAERFRNVACLVDGMNPWGDDELREAGLVEAASRQRCRAAALRVVDVWGRRLSRYLRAYGEAPDAPVRRPSPR
ncbi:MAG TPA: DUF4344 domain-containing metallopeptidase [Longimicrobium sp.]|nr:DUF4344 domain-containing metallopeptidase [Longimicrobium sp.]